MFNQWKLNSLKMIYYIHLFLYIITYPGQNVYIGSCRAPFKSVVKRMIGSDRLLLNGFRCNPLTSLDIRLSDPTISDKIHKFGTDQIRFPYPTVSDVIRCHENIGIYSFTWHRIVSQNRPLTVTGTCRILQKHRSSFDRIFTLTDNIHPTWTCHRYVSEIIGKLQTSFSILTRRQWR